MVSSFQDGCPGRLPGCRLKNFKMTAMVVILEQNNFSSSDSLCRYVTSHQVLTQSDLQFGMRCHLKRFKIADMAAVLDIGMERF